MQSFLKKKKKVRNRPLAISRSVPLFPGSKLVSSSVIPQIL